MGVSNDIMQVFLLFIALIQKITLKWFVCSVNVAGLVLDKIVLIKNAVGKASIVVEAANDLKNGGEHDVVVTWTPDPAIEPCLISVSPTVRDFPIATI